MTNNAARDLAKNCSQLSVIDLNRCSVSEEKTNISFQLKIRYDFQSLTDDGILIIAEHCSLLETLIIANCRNLTDNTLIALGNHSHQLK